MKGRGTVILRVICMVVMLLAFFPAQAFATNSEEARAEFSDYELGHLLVRVDNVDQSQFVMWDYSGGDNPIYLRVRDAYQSRYNTLVGDDSVRLLSMQSRLTPRTVFSDRSLTQITDTGGNPWRDLLYLTGNRRSDWASTHSSAFKVSQRIALTAAHCVMDTSGFSRTLTVISNVDNTNVNNGAKGVSKVIIPKEWQTSNCTDYDHDFALLVFDSSVPGTSTNRLFSYDSISVADSLGLNVNCAGYLTDYNNTDGIYAWRNENDGGISLIDNLGNSFHADLSWTYGQSGGPVYCLRNGTYVVVGIISSQSSESPYWNYAMRITERCECLVAWAEESGYSNISSGGDGGGSQSPSTGGSVSQMWLGDAGERTS